MTLADRLGDDLTLVMKLWRLGPGHGQHHP